ncbi:hypothetical protein ACFX13_009907 [Malus domestica]
MHDDLKTAAKSVNHWSGVTTLIPLFGGFVADAYLGHFKIVFFFIHHLPHGFDSSMHVLVRTKLKALQYENMPRTQKNP